MQGLPFITSRYTICSRFWIQFHILLGACDEFLMLPWFMQELFRNGFFWLNCSQAFHVTSYVATRES
uniref:Uncharacterized protein n=1 Tax=Arundo donax TaxID=35708 RepID=A0A0A9FM14_ARUDO